MWGDGEEAAGLKTERLSLTRVWRDRPTSLNGLSVQTLTACRTGCSDWGSECSHLHAATHTVSVRLSLPVILWAFLGEDKGGRGGGAGWKFDAMNKNAITYTSPSALRLYKWALKSISHRACKAVCERMQSKTRDKRKISQKRRKRADFVHPRRTYPSLNTENIICPLSCLRATVNFTTLKLKAFFFIKCCCLFIIMFLEVFAAIIGVLVK